MTVKVNDSGSDEPDFLISGPGNIAFDRRGYAWVTNNTFQGTPNSSNFNLVFKPNGQPADGRNRTPRSPLTGGGVLGGGYGVTIDPHGSVWFGNFGWGDCKGCDPSRNGNGSVSRFTRTACRYHRLMPTRGPVRAMGMASDAEGNIWISSVGNNSVYVFKHGNPHQSVRFDQQLGSRPFDIAIAADGSAWVSNGLGPPRTIAKYALVNGALVQRFRHLLGDQLRGIALDSHGNAWVASQGTSCMRVGLTAQRSAPSTAAASNNPWGVTVDGEDNIWVANFGPLELTSDFTGRLTKLWGVNAPPATTWAIQFHRQRATPCQRQVAGVLHNGEPLYGPTGPPCFIPMMRQTAVEIDQAGNIWSINNWKPDFAIDTVGRILAAMGSSFLSGSQRRLLPKSIEIAGERGGSAPRA